ncbi:MAG: DctP family TRAP transporter solute-binding subunit [Deltaproteobacteria bacterium]|nr:DctP family TRAP transporter solute-binding subunit [Deltaproteobacteria bacterium]
MDAKKTRWIACIVLIIAFWASNVCLAENIIKLGVVTKRGGAQNVCAEKFKSLLEKDTIRWVKIYDNGSLGNESDILKKVQSGEIQMAVVTSGPFDEFVPEARVVDYPYLFKNYQQADLLLDGEPGRQLLKSLEKAGFKGLAFAENGFRNVTANRPIHSADDVAGLRIRVMQSIIHQEIWRLLGATPIPLGWPINKELKAKTVEAQENPVFLIRLYKIYKLQKYLSLTRHVYSSHIAVANLAWFQSLNADDQTAIQSAMIKAARFERDWNRKNEAKILNILRKTGMVINEKPDINSFKNRLADLEKSHIFKDESTSRMLKIFMDAAR